MKYTIINKDTGATPKFAAKPMTRQELMGTVNMFLNINRYPDLLTDERRIACYEKDSFYTIKGLN